MKIKIDLSRFKLYLRKDLKWYDLIATNTIRWIWDKDFEPISENDIKEVFKVLYGDNWKYKYENRTSHFDDFIKHIKNKLSTTTTTKSTANHHKNIDISLLEESNI